jgi:hypothetical protein
MQLAIDTRAPRAGFKAWFSSQAATTPATTVDATPAGSAPAHAAEPAPRASAAVPAGSPLRQLAAGGSLLPELPQGVELVCLQGTL